jgi:hypothetical protein
LCGSGLARECGGSATDALTDTLHSRASPLPHKLTQHVISGVFENVLIKDLEPWT